MLYFARRDRMSLTKPGSVAWMLIGNMLLKEFDGCLRGRHVSAHEFQARRVAVCRIAGRLVARTHVVYSSN